MSSGNYSLLQTVVTGQVITASERNAEHTNHITNCNPAGVAGDSDTVSAMRATTTPGTAGSESLATSLDGELQRLRYVLVRLLQYLNASGINYWYDAPTGTIPETLLPTALTQAYVFSYAGTAITVNNNMTVTGTLTVGTLSLTNVSASGSISAGTTITAGTGLTVTAGGATVTAGDLAVSAGKITSSGDIQSSGGALKSSASKISGVLGTGYAKVLSNFDLGSAGGSGGTTAVHTFAHGMGSDDLEITIEQSIADTTEGPVTIVVSLPSGFCVKNGGGTVPATPSAGNLAVQATNNGGGASTANHVNIYAKRRS